MPTADPTDYLCLAIWQAAAAEPLGIIVGTNNPTKTRQTLYNFRKTFGDPTFAPLQIKVSPLDPEGEVWILNTAEANATLASTVAVELL